ncbi:HAMP domain-containing histidine kinase [Yersinia enterocolitica]|nr:HAMP domain-containing histidine kinase [Yersinia enterocolitica]
MKRKTILQKLFELLSILTILVMVVTTLVYYIYGFLVNLNMDEMVPDDFDYLNTLVSTLTSILIAFFFSVTFTKRLSPPLASIASAARSIAEGDLKARADSGHNELIELDNMVRDFNLMAEKLEIMSRDMQVWNATIAHELRTPVTILRGNLQAVLDGVMQSDHEHTLLLLNHVDNLASLIDDLRIVSLADSGKIRLYREHTSINEMLLEIQKYVTPEFHLHNKKLEVRAEEIVGYVDNARLKQAVMALLHNSLQYSDEGEISLSCYYSHNKIIISVEDQGPGIPEEHRAHIFKPFYRIHETQRLTRNSSGLGLSVVKAIADAHGGSVVCDMNCNGGTVFRIIL